MTIGYSTSSGDSLEVDADGAFRMRVLTGSRVGRFAGTVEHDAGQQLELAASAAREAGSSARVEPWRSEATTGSISIDGTVVFEFDVHDDIAGPWADVVDRARALVEVLLDQPLAALALELRAQPLHADVRHIGSDPLTVDLSSATVEAYLVGSDGATHGSWTGRLEAPDTGIEPGWEADLRLEEAGFELTDGRACEVTVHLALPDPVPYPAQLWGRVE